MSNVIGVSDIIALHHAHADQRWLIAPTRKFTECQVNYTPTEDTTRDQVTFPDNNVDRASAPYGQLGSSAQPTVTGAANIEGLNRRRKGQMHRNCCNHETWLNQRIASRQT